MPATRKYKITKLFEDKRSANTAAKDHFEIGQEITTTELRKFCRAYSFVYEAEAIYNNRPRYIKAMDSKLNIHVEAWG